MILQTVTIRRTRNALILSAGAWDIDKLYTDDSPETAPPVLRALAKAISLYNLDKEDFLEIVAGMEMDTDTSMVVPNCKRLQLYCDRVAGAVGLLSIKIFGVSDASARTFALRLGTALQLTNILRDLKDDARMGRLYLHANSSICMAYLSERLMR